MEEKQGLKEHGVSGVKGYSKHLLNFTNRPFDELFDYMSTPKYRLDRGARDNLENSHIK
jgi:hypothetical protein